MIHIVIKNQKGINNQSMSIHLEYTNLSLNTTIRVHLIQKNYIKFKKIINFEKVLESPIQLTNEYD